MYKHLVFWKLKERGNGLSKSELAIEVKRQLQTLPGLIPEIKSFEVGLNVGNYSALFFDVSMIAVFDNEEEFWKYTKYPAHDQVVKFIQSVQVEEQIVDYKV